MSYTESANSMEYIVYDLLSSTHTHNEYAQSATRYGVHIIEGNDPYFSRGPKYVEYKVFEETFGNTSQQLDREYGSTQTSSLFICVVDYSQMLPVGVMRIIQGGKIGLKSIQDLDKWGISYGDGYTELGVPESEVWDIATLAVTKECRQGAEGGAVSIALYQTLCAASNICDISRFVAIFDTKALAVVQRRMKKGFKTFEGAKPTAYLDSTASLPVWCDVPAWRARIRISDPTVEALAFSEGGIPGIVAPPDWAAFRAKYAHQNLSEPTI